MTLLSRPTETKTRWRWIEYLCEDPNQTMDRDKLLFNESKNFRSASFLRFYRWKNPTLSYGRIQGIDPKTQTDWNAKGYSVIERPTGGGKVFHQTDLCFSLIWKKDNPEIPWNICDSYHKIHCWIQVALRELGHECELTNQKKTMGERGWCFMSPVFYDLMQNGSKVAGGAQWRDKNTALHQGSIQIQLPMHAVNIFKEQFQSYFQVNLEC